MILLLPDTGVQSITKCRSWFVVTSAKPYTCPTCEQVSFEYDEDENTESLHAVGLGREWYSERGCASQCGGGLGREWREGRNLGCGRRGCSFIAMPRLPIRALQICAWMLWSYGKFWRRAI